MDITSPARLQMAHPSTLLDALGFPANGLAWMGVWHVPQWRGAVGRAGSREWVVSGKVSPSAPLRRRGSNMRHRSLWPSHPALACLKYLCREGKEVERIK